ncbi:hypothetical protein Clacol_004294 [Clathrus columnatus]|uniref:Xylanolytic transcriptional activator regulatory domain-containing protein n=1 Tax=Clathrus columnatus TaxID=1419009 RepID=A0AAV5A9C5_9AGAM|nr:hypothetical protein Clacol_004294 [Clathrus columnatus]
MEQHQAGQRSKAKPRSAIEASQLREKTAAMGDRIRQLEEALAVAHAKTSTEVHVLLAKPEDLQGENFTEHGNQNGLQNDVIDAFGTLSIGSDGRSKYHNQSAGADYFAEAESPDVPTAGARAFSDGIHAPLPQEILHLASMFPFGPSENEFPLCTIDDLISGLPPADIAWNICEIFFTHGDWLFAAINRAEFMDGIYHPIYASDSSPSTDRLSLLFIILALGALLDISKPYDIRNTEFYYQLARAAFCLEPLIEAATIPTIQSLHFQIIYLYMTERQTVEHRWLNMGLIAKLVYSTGLHRDSGNWIHDNEAEIERRRKLFWEIYAYDAWISFIMGRPPSFNLPHIHCRLPKDVDPISNEQGIPQPSFHTVWKYQYRTQCLVPVVEEAFGAKAPNYATILKLDRRIRDFEIPTSLQLGFPTDGNQGSIGLPLSMQRYMLFCERETSLLYLHRAYFAQAVCDSPDNPLESKYATSVSATYRSACLIVAGTHDATVRHPELASRFWWFWSNLFSAAIVLGSIVTRSPACQLSASAMNELDLACNLMEHRAAPGRSAKAVPILRRLRDKARLALAQPSQGSVIDKASPQSNSNSSNKDDDDELAIFAGRTRFISNTARSRSPTRSPSSSQGVGSGGRITSARRRGSESLGPSNIRLRTTSNRRGSEPFPYDDTIPTSESEVFRQAHPSLLEHLRGINGYVPPPAIMQGIIAAREERATREATMTGPAPPGHSSLVKSEVPYQWGESSNVAPPSSSSPNAVFMTPPTAPYEIPTNHGSGGMYVPDAQPNPAGLMAQAVGTFGYPAELNGDGTWQQLMAQLGVLDGSN